MLLALTSCVLYVSSTSIATKQDAMVPFHFDSKTNMQLDRVLLPVFVFLTYLVTSIPIPAPQTKGGLRTACEYTRFTQKHFLLNKFIRPILLVYLALHLAFKSFVVIQEVAIYGILGRAFSVVSKLLPKAVCAQSDSLCDVYKGATWAALVLSILVIVDVVITDKKRAELLEHEDAKDARRHDNAPEEYAV
ncbi:hypothetical protein BGX31_007837 [Mortierella sp. GBA43]|nr:hypothetical protein BGX31_007837 [Mortierella sp. GBA43]